MTLNKKPYRGCRDFYPLEMRVREYLFQKMRNAAESFGYLPYDGPLLEEVELYKAKSGEELINDQIYAFTDRGERQVAIRPEMTPTLARMIANIHRQESKPIRWYSIPNLMRYEKPQRGRVREHWQFNVDIFGAPEELGECEVLSLIKSFLCSLGADHKMFSIKVNDRNIVETILRDCLQLSPDQSYRVYKVIDKAGKITQEKLALMLNEIISDPNKITILNQYLALDSFDGLKRFGEQYEIEVTAFLSMIQRLDQLDLTPYLTYDPTIVRGLDYYTGLVFEIFDKHPDNNRAIAGGGAYANLLKIFNEEALPAVGFGLGDVTLKDFLESHKLLPSFENALTDIFVVTTDPSLMMEVLKISASLRATDFKVETNLSPLKFNKIFKLAESKGHNRVGILEKKEGKIQIQIKNLATREGEFIDFEDLDRIKKALA